MQLGIKKLVPDSIIPTRGSDGAAGYDLYSNEDCVIEPNDRCLVSTGISIVLPGGVYGRVAPRSSLSVKHGIQVGAGVIDPDYTGEVKVILFNHGVNDYFISKGDRIAQLILERCETPPVVEIDTIEATKRGSGGFGSTGV